VWPEVTVRARNQQEVECLLSAFAQMGISCLVQPDFRVEVGGAHPPQILRAVQQCLTRNEIESVDVSLSTGEYVLYKGE
jgi:hypothetical protein